MRNNRAFKARAVLPWKTRGLFSPAFFMSTLRYRCPRCPRETTLCSPCSWCLQFARRRENLSFSVPLPSEPCCCSNPLSSFLRSRPRRQASMVAAATVADSTAIHQVEYGGGLARMSVAAFGAAFGAFAAKDTPIWFSHSTRSAFQETKPF